MKTGFELIDVLTGYQSAAAVAAACRVGVFDALAAGARTADEVAAVAGLAAGPTGALLAALAELGLVGRDGYALTPLAERLRRGGDLEPLVRKEAFFAAVWTDLDATVRTGAPRLAPWRDRLRDEPEVARNFLAALVVLARETGPDLTALPEFAPGRRVLDVGGALGSYAVPLAAAGADVTLVDLPEVAAWARTCVPPTVRVVEADVLEVAACGAAPGSVDTVLLSHLLHDLTDAQCARVLAEARRALAPGGAVVVVEIPSDAPGTMGPLFDLMMRIETPGKARKVNELEDLLHLSGLPEVREAAYPRPVVVLIGETA
ncbi:methyltransferase domain-containing protein [Actinocorallia sp. API 0066]|uniref:methyltransferase n=1 Tax=Actinocorallia sp. API 0066 TaxID=2896846 RepID=UPI001E39472D|nr:methyltransferase [Actinocorallia sp. API 0066]MCD0452067.1 methyltransferase domain-containing protein [Actinocorallia sp. API 0066]